MRFVTQRQQAAADEEMIASAMFSCATADKGSSNGMVMISYLHRNHSTTDAQEQAHFFCIVARMAGGSASGGGAAALRAAPSARSRSGMPRSACRSSATCKDRNREPD